MKSQLEKWGFTHIGIIGNSNYYVLISGKITVQVKVIGLELVQTTLTIGGRNMPIPNCNSQFMLLTFLYQLDLISLDNV